jgi:hypothetical protein
MGNCTGHLRREYEDSILMPRTCFCEEAKRVRAIGYGWPHL